jgi:hypothetical protein
MLTTLPAAMDDATMLVGNVPGAFVPSNTAESSARPMACSSSGRTEPHTSKLASSSTFSGIGTIAASSSMLRNLLPQLTSVVCLSPVSPLTQYAIGRAERIGRRDCDCATGMFVNASRTNDSFSRFPSMTLTTSSGMSAAASVRLMTLL